MSMKDYIIGQWVIAPNGVIGVINEINDGGFKFVTIGYMIGERMFFREN